MSVSDGTAGRYSIEAISAQRIYQEVASQLRRSISEGRLRPGDKLPPERSLAVMFGVSRNTVRDALCTLELSGLIARPVASHPDGKTTGATLQSCFNGDT